MKSAALRSTLPLSWGKILIFTNSSASKLETEYIRSKYINRELQLAVETKPQDVKKRIAGDPAIISDCFVHHVAYYKQDYFLELYGPLRDSQLTSDIRSALTHGWSWCATIE